MARGRTALDRANERLRLIEAAIRAAHGDPRKIVWPK